ncbi:hypothetical protein WCLP8_3570003 [uncultured Gammaproteobacteria bacterium]
MSDVTEAEKDPVSETAMVVRELAGELAGLRQAVGELTAAVRDLVARGPVAAVPTVAMVPVVADRMTEEQARTEIREYFLTHRDETIYPEQIAKALNLRLLQVMDICESLAGGGLLHRQG